MLLVPNSKSGDNVPIQLGTWVIDTRLHFITKKELSNASSQWQRVHLSSVISRQANLNAGSIEAVLYLSWIQGTSEPPEEL